MSICICNRLLVHAAVFLNAAFAAGKEMPSVVVDGIILDYSTKAASIGQCQSK